MDEYVDLYVYGLRDGHGVVPGDFLAFGGTHKVTGETNGCIAIVRSAEDYRRLTTGRKVAILPSAEPFLSVTPAPVACKVCDVNGWTH